MRIIDDANYLQLGVESQSRDGEMQSILAGEHFMHAALLFCLEIAFLTISPSCARLGGWVGMPYL